MTVTPGIATITAIAAVGNSWPIPGSSKKIMLDTQIYVSSSNCESLFGALSYFNGSDMVFRNDEITLYLIYATVSFFYFFSLILTYFSARLQKWRMEHMYIPILTQRRVMILLEIFYGSVCIFLLFDGLLNVFLC